MLQKSEGKKEDTKIMQKFQKKEESHKRKKFKCKNRCRKYVEQRAT